ncbi:hypothetical protein [Candidatus Phytoplasma phoenicium]|uniref:Uncharacterized protein n=1 Tax=Candidatus Phytoplasma phoenicium TaxID=198422 RepID=A0A0L0MIT8_9MOLU|nr:hypothetical protein [Candidatus Phytoplasma phoenicium]KND62567.1 hypothetical protein AlmWB_02410 [Candidatus Phytoplasma phoenicium]
MNHFLKIFENKIIILFFIIISCIISIFSYNGDIGDIIKNKKTFSKSNFQFVDFFRSPKTLLSKFDNNLVKTLAYLGLNQFVIGLIENKIPEYEDIFLVDSEMFIPKVLNGNLGTSSTSLIQGTIDFLSFKLNKI